jgi:1-acyl-sn-glycerol-3-phosphate acyltransferase
MFDDIRPYRDDEVVPVIHKLINEKALQASLASYATPRLYRLFPTICRTLVKLSLQWKLKRFTTVDAIQTEVEKYLHKLIKKSTDGFSFNGLTQLDMTKPTLFISNHRDIALDPALINIALFKCNATTVEIAIGDNLLSKPWIADLMRLNKSFIVKRNLDTKRAMLNASKSLSAYIHHTLIDNNHNVWIAQREGRAKDGIDKTNSALISMLLLNKEKSQPIAQYLDQLNIVPVSISYQYDPCDSDKAKELATIEATGSYQKAEGEDLKSITQGIVGHKGLVHIEFGTPISGDYENSKAIAAEIDRQIIKNYKLYDSNIAAEARLNTGDESKPLPCYLNKKLQQLDQDQQRWLLAMYANPVIAKAQQDN